MNHSVCHWLLLQFRNPLVATTLSDKHALARGLSDTLSTTLHHTAVKPNGFVQCRVDLARGVQIVQCRVYNCTMLALASSVHCNTGWS